MGYITRDVAVITEPKRVSLSGLPNFVQFQSKPGVKLYLEVDIKVNVTRDTLPLNSSVLRIVEPSGTVHEFRGTLDPAEVGGAVFYLSSVFSDTAENLRQALLADQWINANFEVRLPFIWVNGAPINGDVINIRSKGAGDNFEIQVLAPNNADDNAYTITWAQSTTTNNDSISGESTTVQIELDVFIDAPIFLGADDRALTSALLGSYALTLSKTYSGSPLWFNINAPFSKAVKVNVPTNTGWFDTGTMRTFRFVARIAGVNNFTFYQSNALYMLRGYSALSDEINIDQYVYEAEKIKLLTNKPRTHYVKGQKEYLNFILSDSAHGNDSMTNWTLQVLYRAYNSIGEYIGEQRRSPVDRKSLHMVNTCVLEIDQVLLAYPGAAQIKVSLERDSATISNDLEYDVRPESLHTLQQFSFLNRLGGWDTFNFDAAPTEDVKVSFDTFSRTVTPAYKRGDGVETVYSAQLDNTRTVVGAPVSDEVAEWLKELAASTVVLDDKGRHIIKLEFTAPVSEGSKNMQVPTMKYKLSETYTNE